MALYTVILLVSFLFAHDFSYSGWAGLFAAPWMKVATFVALLALFYHVWIGMRDIWMDYIEPTGVKLLLQLATILWLIGCAGCRGVGALTGADPAPRRSFPQHAWAASS